MGILALDERTRIALATVAFAMSVVGIHRAVDVGLAPVACIAQRPHDDGRMILQYIYIMALTLDVRVVETGILRERFLAVAHSVTLDVGLGGDVDAILVAKVVPTGIVGIVAGAHGIHVQLLHHLNVLNHAVNRYDITAIGVQFVTVHTLDEDGLTIHEQLLVFNLHLAETYALRNTFQYPILLDGKVTHLLRSDVFARWVEKLNFICLASSSRSCQLDGELTIVVVVGQIGRDEHIVDVRLRTCIEISLAGNAAETPEVLVFVPRTIAPTHDLHGNQILLARNDVLSDVELASYLGILRIAHILAVHVNCDVGSGRTDVHVHILAFPIGRDGERATIRAHVIALVLHSWWFTSPVATPCIGGVHIDGIAVTIQFPYSRHRHRAPMRVVIIQRIESLGTLVGTLHPMELPLALDAHVAA